MVIDVVCAIIRNASGEMLVAQRPADKGSPLKWEFPGGKVDPGETHEAALVRELAEELGIVATVGRAYTPVIAEVGAKTLRMTAFEVPAYTGTMEAREHVGLRWIRREDFGALDWAPLDVPLLAQLGR